MGAWTEIVDYTVPSNTTSVVLNNFGTITKDDFIKVVATFTNATGSFIDVALLANSSTTSNYHNQLLISDGTGVSASRSNTSLIHAGRSITDGTGLTVGYLKLSENDRFNMFFNDTRVISDGTQLQVNYTYSTSSGATFTSGITSLTFSAANSIKAGSRIQIYRLDAEKVADITVASNTTQVDISNLSIGKDSEYLLVADIVASGNPLRSTLRPNDIANNQFYYQSIDGDGTSAFAGKNQFPFVIYAEGNNRAIGYIHIKLSEIGAYTHQSYMMAEYGSSEVNIKNSFASSISEAITSITKLTFDRYSGTVDYAAGSRFMLYKLK